MFYGHHSHLGLRDVSVQKVFYDFVIILRQPLSMAHQSRGHWTVCPMSSVLSIQIGLETSFQIESDCEYSSTSLLLRNW